MFLIVGLLIVFVLLLIFSNRRTRGCRWRARSTPAGAPRRYVCMACGAETAPDSGDTPDLCLRPRRPPG